MHASAIPKQSKDRAFFQGVMTHYLFVFATFALIHGLSNVGFAVLKLPPAMAMLPSFLLLTDLFGFMALTRTSIVGAPGFNCPPAAAIVLAPLTTLMMLTVCYRNFDTYKELVTPAYVALLVLPHVLIHGFGMMHRRLGYSNAQVDADFGHKAKCT